MKLYLAFLGTQTIAVRANSIKAARAQVIAAYATRGIHLANREVRVRSAYPSDAGWLRDAGAEQLADEVSA